MRRLLLVALPVGLAVLAGILLLTTSRAASDAAEARLERARLKRDFTERAQAAKAVAAEPPGEWQAEVQALSRWYFDELAAIRNRHPAEPPRPGALQAAEEERKGKLAKEERDAIADFQQYAEGRLRLLREGRYAPVASALAEGLRLDLLAVEPGPAPGAEPHPPTPPSPLHGGGGARGLRVDFALWGAPRYLERARSGDKTVARTVVPVAFRTLSVRFLDPAGKLYGEMTGAGEPYQKLTDPERFAEDFPPGALFGTWWVELFPREAATAEVELAVDLRAPSGALRPAIFRTRLPVPEGWKLPPGAAFQAEVRRAEPAR
jgi:hypothetical protein